LIASGASDLGESSGTSYCWKEVSRDGVAARLDIDAAVDRGKGIVAPSGISPSLSIVKDCGEKFEDTRNDASLLSLGSGEFVRLASIGSLQRRVYQEGEVACHLGQPLG